MAHLPLLLRRRPPPEALAWVERSLGAGWRITSLRRLRGGTSSAVHLLRAHGPGGDTRAVVLRRLVRPGWFEPGAAEREAHVLTALERAGIPAPRVVAVDPTGVECDVAAVLMTRLPGRIDLAPADLDAYVRALAEPLPALHALGPVEGAPSYYPYFNDRAEQPPAPPSWTRRPDLWRAAAAIVSQPWPEAEPTFIHRDYHPGNVLWQRGRLAGITDWVNASNGPRALDAAHCRVNLSALFGVDAAERFRRAYESIVGVEQHPYWDLLDALDTGPPAEAQWTDAGRRDLPTALLRSRCEAYLETLVRRLC